MVLVIIAIIVVLLILVGIALYIRHAQTERQRLEAEAAAKTAEAARAAAEAEVLRHQAEVAAAKAAADAKAAQEAAAAKAAADAAAAAAAKAAQEAAIAQAAAAEAARKEAAGKAAAAASQRGTLSYYNRGTGRDYVYGRAINPTTPFAGKGVMLGQFDTEEKCAAAALASKESVGYGWYTPQTAVWGSTCVGILEKNPSYVGGTPSHVYGIKRDPHDPAVVLREAGKNYAFARVASPTTPAIFETGVSKIYGAKPDEMTCMLSCYDDPICNAYTYHDAPEGSSAWAKVCVGTSEKNPISYIPGGPGHKSGRVL